MIKISSLLDQEKIKEGMEKGILKEWMITTYSDFRNSLLDDSAHISHVLNIVHSNF